MASIQEVKDAVAEQTTVTQGVVTMLDGLSQQLKDAVAAGDPAAVDAVLAEIRANTKSLADAVVRNTDVEDEVHAGGM